MVFLKKKLENFWYHYKWTTIVVAFFVLLLGIGIVQMISKEDYDAQVLYAGPSVTLIEQGADDRISSAFSRLLSDDHNGDGKKNILLHSYTVISDEQLAERQEEAKKENDSVYYDPSLRKNAISNISSLMATGEVAICLFDPYVYGVFDDQEGFAPLSEILGYTPEGAQDEYTIRLKDTEFGSYFSCFDALPDDTLLCIRKEPYAMGFMSSKKQLQENYAYSCELFRAIMAFQSPE